MAKDRAAPFSRKHRRYWIPVTGGMILIGLLNVTIGLCSYEPAPDKHVRMQVGTPPARPTIDAAGSIGVGELPAAVMRSFAAKYPQTIPAKVEQAGDRYVITFPPGKVRTRATFTAEGGFVSDE